MARLIFCSSLFWVLAVGCSTTSPPDCPMADASTPIASDASLIAGFDDASTHDAATDGGSADAALGRPPQIPRNTGRVLSPLTLVALIASNDPDVDALRAFGEHVGATAWWRAVSDEYGAGAIDRAVTYVGPAITSSISRAELRAYVAAAIQRASVPAPNGNTLYLVYVPAPFRFSDTSDCGYHTSFPDAQATIGDGVAGVRRCAPKDNEQASDRLTTVASHELIEAATDPTLRSYSLGITPAMPWTEPISRSVEMTGVVEVADLCEGTRIREDQTQYQRSWSNRAAAAGDDPCAPALAIPYYNLSADAEWFAGAPGAMVSIPFVGVAAASAAVWRVNPHRINWTGAFHGLVIADFAVTTDLGPVHAGACVVEMGMQAGVHGTMTVKVPASALPGDFVVFSIHSFRLDAACRAAPDEDLFHELWVGVYVP